jgi:hypothetical protein
MIAGGHMETPIATAQALAQCVLIEQIARYRLIIYSRNSVPVAVGSKQHPHLMSLLDQGMDKVGTYKS